MSISNEKIIRIGAEYNEPLDNLSEGVEEIYFDNESKFNHPLDNLPKSLKILKLGFFYNKPLDFLPAGLETLIISYYYKYPMINFPAGLKRLGLPVKPPPPPFGKHLHEYQDIVGDKVEFFMVHKSDFYKNKKK